jgi:hypothetical protein
MLQKQSSPKHWGNDGITQYIDNCRTNQFATFANKPIFKKIEAIDDCFFRILDKPINPRPWFPFQFIQRSHSAFRAASSMIMAGQIIESNAILRLALETAAYGFYISTDDKIAETWIRRNDGPDERKSCKRDFQVVKIKELISQRAPKIGEIFDTLYDRTIDYGAHPNEKGFSLNSQINERESGVEFLHIYLQGNGIALDYSLKSLAQVGIWCLSIFQLIYPEKFELLGIKERLVELRKDI